MTRFGTLLLLALAAPVVAQGGAASENEPAWYQVEVLIFRYLETATETESWPDLPELSYPQSLRHLRAGAAAGDLQQVFELQRIEETVPVTDFGLAWDKSAAQLQREYDESVQALAAAAAVVLPADLPEDQATPDNATDNTLPLPGLNEMTVPRAFVPMVDTAAEFRPQALSIRRSRDKRLMFHRSWLQPLRARERSLAIAVDGLIEEGDYPTLQGSLLLYVSRYLHVETTIWLNTHDETELATQAAIAASGIKLAASAWQTPPPPLPPSAYTWSPWAFQVHLETGFSSDITLPLWSFDDEQHYATETVDDEVFSSDGYAGETTGAPVEAGQANAADGEASAAAGMTIAAAGMTIVEPEPIVAEFDPADILQPVVITAQRIPVLDIEQILAQKWYPFERAVLVKHKRRMRGGEVHYLDHPLLGIILRVSPYEFEPFIAAQELAGSSP